MRVLMILISMVFSVSLFAAKPGVDAGHEAAKGQVSAGDLSRTEEHLAKVAEKLDEMYLSGEMSLNRDGFFEHFGKPKERAS